MEFILEAASIPFANALRRIMVTEVPVLAIDWIDLEYNSSSMFDEMIAQRLGLLPLSYDPGKIRDKEEVMFALEKTGPGMVYSKDLKSANKSVKPLEPNFPIADLLGDHHIIKLEATARLGTGKEHAKFQAANAVYENYPELKEGKVNTTPDKFLFKVESISGLTPEYIVSTAAQILEEKAKTFKKEATKL